MGKPCTESWPKLSFRHLRSVCQNILGFRLVFVGSISVPPTFSNLGLWEDDELSYALGKQGGTRKKLERASGPRVAGKLHLEGSGWFPGN